MVGLKRGAFCLSHKHSKMELYFSPSFCFVFFETGSVCIPGWTQTHLLISILYTITTQFKREGRREGEGEGKRESERGRSWEEQKGENCRAHVHSFARQSVVFILLPFNQPVCFSTPIRFYEGCWDEAPNLSFFLLRIQLSETIGSL